MKQKTCYLCDEIATSVEHVPPRCLFPEQKDLPEGVNLRKQLFTVPSCDTHNSLKSHDDEYLFYVLGGCNQINKIGRNHYTSKIRRSIKRNPSLVKRLFSTAVPVNIIDPHTMKQEESLAFTLEPARFDNIIAQLSRAIYYHHFKKKWIGDVQYQAEFLAATVCLTDESNTRIKEMSAEADLLFKNVHYFGENPEVFKYQAIENEALKTLRLDFYEGCRLLLMYK
jgi:hypothetical protein